MMFGKKEKAYWIRKTHLLRRDEFYCSACGSGFTKPASKCPQCSADMRKTRHEASWVDEAELLDIIDG